MTGATKPKEDRNDTARQTRDSAGRSTISPPPREQAGQVEERILDAAGRVFLEHGFQGASVDEIAEAASAGKPTIYARFPNKPALFTAVIERLVRRNTALDALSCAGDSIEERLDALASIILTRILAPETIGFIRVAVAEARRFPELATASAAWAPTPIEAVTVYLANWLRPTRSGLRPHSRRTSSRRRLADSLTWRCCRC